MLPQSIVDRPTINRRLGIKSSVNDPKALIASIFLLWIGCNQSSDLQYSDPKYNDKEQLKLNPDLVDKIKNNIEKTGFTLPDNYKEIFESTPLFKTQMEALQVAIQLIWKLGAINFTQNDLTVTAERTGKVRYIKKISFSLMMDIFDQIYQDENGNYKKIFIEILWSWLTGQENENELHEDKLVKILTALSENVHMKNGRGSDEITFQQCGIYQTLYENEDNSVHFEGDKVGPLRIISSSISQKMHSYLTLSRNNFILRDDKKNDIKDYTQRVNTYLNLIETNHNIIISPDNEIEKSTDESIDFAEKLSTPHNWLIYGAPGTGKSYFLDRKSEDLNINIVKRIIFYEDYTYSQFVGGYKPSHIYDPSEGNGEYKKSDGKIIKRPGKPIIEYQFVPGPLLSILVDAINNPDKNYLLLIEELNRANAPAVFGDIFQLLDRDETGESNYPITLSQEAMSYLYSQSIDKTEITLPRNLYLWATMNNADQGVIPLDTAFKRRWQFHYMMLDNGRDIVEDLEIPSSFLNENGGKISLNWNFLRDNINKELSLLGIHEDLLIGPFFLKKEEFSNDQAFQFKLLSYLRDDLLRHRADSFFSKSSSTLSELLKSYKKGENIFKFSLEE